MDSKWAHVGHNRLQQNNHNDADREPDDDEGDDGEGGVDGGDGAVHGDDDVGGGGGDAVRGAPYDLDAMNGDKLIDQKLEQYAAEVLVHRRHRRWTLL